MDCEPSESHLWKEADAIFHSSTPSQGTWEYRTSLPEDWSYRDWFGALKLSCHPSGNLGIFPEQIENWNWIRQLPNLHGKRLINLFAHTGGTTLALAQCGAEVTHVDSARSSVNEANENTKRSLPTPSIRWLVEDVLRFVRLEIKRGASYDGVALDPPAFGRGPKGEIWKLDTDLPTLLNELRTLIPNPCLLLVTCHSKGWTPDTLKKLVLSAFPQMHKNATQKTLSLITAKNRTLASGTVFRSYLGSH